MISKRLLEAADVAIYDPVAANRNATRAALYSLGFRGLDAHSTLEALETRLRERAPDLLLAEVTGREIETCSMVQSLRQGNLGSNPFVIVILTSWRRDGTIIYQVLNSGADDLIARPVSGTAMGERISLLVERRKGFVVTWDYIGPDRRRDPRASGSECIDIPNPLKLKAVDKITPDAAAFELSQAVKNAKQTIDLEKIRRDSVQLCLQNLLLSRAPPGSDDFSTIIFRMRQITSDMGNRAGNAGRGDAQQLCGAAIRSIRMLNASLDVTEDAIPTADISGHLRALENSVTALGKMFAPEEVEPGHLVDLESLVAVRRTRSAAA